MLLKDWKIWKFYTNPSKLKQVSRIVTKKASKHIET